jgi:hypothetical protein
MMLNSANWVPIWRTKSRDYNGTATVRILEILEESESREGEGGGREVEIVQPEICWPERSETLPNLAQPDTY